MKIFEFIIEELVKGDLVYVVFGYLRVVEKIVSIIERLVNEKYIVVEILFFMSFVDVMFNYLVIDLFEGFKLVDVFEIENLYIDLDISMIII